MTENKLPKTENKPPSKGLLLCSGIIIPCLLGVLAVSYIRSNDADSSPAQTPDIDKKHANEWLEAVKKDQRKKAILLAKKLVDDTIAQVPNTDYMQLIHQKHLGTPVLTSGFNDFDYMRWRDALLVQQIVNSPNSLPGDVKLLGLFKKMTAKIKKLPKPVKNYPSSPSITGIWNKKIASTRELCRLFSAIAQQAGYDAQVVSLFNQNSNVIHIFCEIRKNNRSYIADPRFNFFAADSSAASLAQTPSSIPENWPSSIAACLKNRLYALPAEVADYKLYNQQLHAKLSASQGKKFPRFGVDPQTQIDEFIKKYPNKAPNQVFTYWTFPFISLISSPDFPQKWKLKTNKQALRQTKK